MSVRRLAAGLALALLALLLAATPARADRSSPTEEERARAAELKKQGDEAMVSLRYADALGAYDEAFTLVDDDVLVYNRGRAHQLLGHFPEALEQLEAFDARAPAELKARVSGLRGLIAEVRGRVTVLTVTTNVGGARLVVRDKIVGTTPLARPLVVNAGKASIELSADGYHVFRKDIDLPAGGTSTVDAPLFSKATTGVLAVTSSTPGTRVTVDGRPAGTVPVEVVVKAGSHSVVLRHEGYHDAESSAVVAAGERKSLSVPLEAERAITARWWFWAGVGVVVVGGAVLTGALLTEEPAPKGSIEPGQVSAPIRAAGALRF